MLGMMATILSFLQRQVGLRTDVADAAGSLHGKVSEVRNTIVNVELPKLQRPYGLVTGNGSTSSTSYVDLVNITGRGTFYWAYAHRDGYQYGAGIKLIIDGKTVCQGEVSSVTDRYWLSILSLTTSQTILPLPFKSSLQIQGRLTSGLNYPLFWWAYAIE